MKKLIVNIRGRVCLYFDIWNFKFIFHINRGIIIKPRWVYLIDAHNVCIYINFFILGVFDNSRFNQLIIVWSQTIILVVRTWKDSPWDIIYWFIILLMSLFFFITFTGICLFISFLWLRFELLINFYFEIKVIIL